MTLRDLATQGVPFDFTSPGSKSGQEQPPESTEVMTVLIRLILSGETSTTMTYDGDGLRRTKQTASGTTTYVWDGSDYLGEIS